MVFARIEIWSFNAIFLLKNKNNRRLPNARIEIWSNNVNKIENLLPSPSVGQM
jgi:hypothetical protein